MNEMSRVANVETRGMFVGGAEIASSSGDRTPIVNPATEEAFAEVASGTPEDVDRAVEAARKGFAALGRMPAHKRARMLFDLARAVEREFDALAALECRNQGKPLRHARGFDIPNVIETLDYYAGAATKLRGVTVDTAPAMFNAVVREPYGVVGAIVPWNYPLMSAVWKVAPAIAAGNAIVIVPAAKTPLTLLRLAALAKEVGFPDGVLNVVTGEGPVVGDALTRHPDVGKISFTGSTETGRAVMANASIHHTPATLELGGKSANIFFDDVDLDQCLKKAVLGIFHNAGQMCLAGSRIFVQDAIYDAFLDRMAAYAGTMRIGDPFGEKTQVGPVISARQRERVLSYIEAGKAGGATLRAGGERPSGIDRGYFIQPTIFADVADDATIARDEIFGPVACVFRFRDEDEAVARANDCRYGLAGAVHTNNLARAHRVASKLQAGNVWINTYSYLTPNAPYGGFKQSGHGRELGMEGVEAFTRTKSIFISPNEG